MKRIAYTANDEGEDGRGPSRVLYATWDEAELTGLVDADKSRPWRRKSEQIVDEDVAIAQALAKLDGIDRLVLGLPRWPARKL